MAYTSIIPKDVVVTDPPAGTAKVSDLDDAIRQFKAMQLYSEWAILNKTESYTLTEYDHIVSFSGSGLTATLPAIAGVASNTITRKYLIHNAGTEAVSVAKSGSDATPSVTSLAAGEACYFMANNSSSAWICLMVTQPVNPIATANLTATNPGYPPGTAIATMTELVDTHSFMASNRFTPSASGTYFISMFITPTVGSYNLAVYVRKNGSSTVTAYSGTSAANVVGSVSMNGTGDYIDVYVQTSHASQWLSSGNILFSRL